VSDAAFPRPRLPALDPVAERPVPRLSALERMAGGVSARLLAGGARLRAARLARVLPLAARDAAALRQESDAGLARRAMAARLALRARPDWPLKELAAALALAREAARRTLGLAAHDVQLTGAHAVLRGMVAEMATGEGKTLVAAIAAGVAALGGAPVHLVTVNRYLAERDAALAEPLWRLLGLTSGCVTEAVAAGRRAAAYRCDIAVCTNKDLAFDYMRDRLKGGRRMGPLTSRAAGLLAPGAGEAGRLLRGLHFAIVDEADSVLVDEARTPLILSGEQGPEAGDALHRPETHDRALEIAERLAPGAHFARFAAERRVALTAGGRREVARLCSGLPEPFDHEQERERLVGHALTALHALAAGEHYLVREGKVEIIDESTGRTMPDRTWTDGLHGMVERKEGLALSPRRETLARMTYQRFFRRYRRLAGMTGTAREVAAELREIYGLRVAAIPTHRPDRKRFLPARGFATAEAKWAAVAARAAELSARGQPVLIGTRTVAASEAASAALAARGVPHAVLSAAQDAAEAEVVAGAGRSGAVTVATNMAGRGTDIRLAPGVAAQGGLAVILGEPHEAGRIDRQLAGRCGRQGDPGLVQLFASAEDDLLRRHAGPMAGLVTGPLGPAMTRLAQRRAEAAHAAARRRLLRLDEWLGDATALAGRQE
jgi:preprotein translocase subunit SecA